MKSLLTFASDKKGIITAEMVILIAVVAIIALS